MAHIQEEITKTKGKAYDVHWPDQDGRPRQKRFYKKREGEAYRSPVETELNEGKYTDPRADRLTFREVAEEWLTTRTRRSSTAENDAAGRSPVSTGTRRTSSSASTSPPCVRWGCRSYGCTTSATRPARSGSLPG